MNFRDESELEEVVSKNYKLLFGEYSIYLPQQHIKTTAGFVAIPDAIVLNFRDRIWYVVEVELARHGIWSHIVPQITKHLVAIENHEVKRKLIDMFTNEVGKSEELKNKFAELGISELEVRKVIEDIIERPPILAVPIDYIPVDLKDFARVLKNEVRLIEIEKYVSEEAQNVAYKIPEYLPTPPPEIEREGEKKVISREEFLRQCDEPAKHLFESLERIANERKQSDRLVPRSTSFSYRVKTNSKEITLLTIYPDSVYIAKYNLKPENGFKPEALEAFAEKIKKIGNLSDIYDIRPIPGFYTRSTDITKDDIDIFIEAFKELLNSLQT